MTDKKETVTYKLIDEDGFKARTFVSDEMFSQFLGKDLSIKGILVAGGDLLCNFRNWLIDKEDLENFFEKVETPSDKSKDILWDGVSPLEVGMVVVNACGGKRRIIFLNKTKTRAVLESLESDRDEESYTYVSALERATLTEKEKAFDEFLTKWSSQSLDFAYDTKDSQSQIGYVFDFVYDMFMEDKGDKA